MCPTSDGIENTENFLLLCVKSFLLLGQHSGNQHEKLIFQLVIIIHEHILSLIHSQTICLATPKLITLKPNYNRKS